MLAPNHESLFKSSASLLPLSLTGCTFTCQMSTRLRLSHFSCKSHAPASCYIYDGSFNIWDALNHRFNGFLMTLRSHEYLVVTREREKEEEEGQVNTVSTCFFSPGEDRFACAMGDNNNSSRRRSKSNSDQPLSPLHMHSYRRHSVTMSLSINITCETLSSLLLLLSLLRSDYPGHPLPLLSRVLSLPQNQIESQSHWFSLSFFHCSSHSL